MVTLVLSTQRIHATFDVRVSDYLSLWNDTHPSLLPFEVRKIEDIYDVNKPLCPGDPAFIARTSAAPANHCMVGIAPGDLKRVIGSEWWWPWNTDVVQKWANVESPDYNETYDSALAVQVKSRGMPLKYDQFASERILMGKWGSMHHRQRCSSTPLSVQRPCRFKADVIVVPSLMAHLQHLRWDDHFAWNLLVPKECILTEER